MLELYLNHIKDETAKASRVNLNNLSSKEENDRQQTFRTLSSTIRSYRHECRYTA